MKGVYSNFAYNVKMYAKYISKVGFRELLVDVILLLLLIVLASLVYIPVGMVQELIRSMINSFMPFSPTIAAFYNAVFIGIGGFCALTFFFYLFNGRYDFKNEKVVPIAGVITFKREDDLNNDSSIEKENDKKEDDTKKKDESEEFDLPKVKEDK